MIIVAKFSNTVFCPVFINTEIGIAWLTETCGMSARKFVITSPYAKIREKDIACVRKRFVNKITKASVRIAILILTSNDE